jgi:hypothetical protein
MKRALVVALALLFLSGAALARTDYFDAVTVGGAFTLSGTAATAFTGATFAVDMSSTAVIDAATSVRNLSAGFNSLESPANRFGVSATVYTQIATTAATGVTAITHTGTGPTMSWTVPVWEFTNSTSNTTFTPSFVVGYDTGSKLTVAVADTTGGVTVSHTGNAQALSWTVPTATWTNATSSTTYTPSWVLGYDAGSSMTAAVADTSGFATITHTGNATGFSWTATTGGFTCATSLTALTPSLVVGFDAGSSVAFGVADTSGALTVSHTGNATALSWTAATATWTHATSDTIYTPSFVLGFDAGSALTFAVADTSGAVTITHAGNATAVTWTATNFDFVGAMAADAVTVSDVLTFSDGGTIDNTAADTLTITETKIALTGDTTVTGTLSATVPTRYEALLSSTPITLAQADTHLYTVPTGKSCVITRIIVRSASGTFDQAQDAVMNMAWDAGVSTVFASATLTTPVAATTWEVYTLVAPGVMGTTGQILHYNVTTPATTAATSAVIDVFGYLF